MQRTPRMGLFVFVAALTMLASIGLWLASSEIKAPTKPNFDNATAQDRQVLPDDDRRTTRKRRRTNDGENAASVEPGEMVYSIHSTSGGFPPERVCRAGDDPLRLQRRVLFRTLELGTDGAGMRIRGSIFTDFFADRLRSSEPRQLAMNVRIRLHFYDVLLERNVVGEIQPVFMDPEDLGRPVAGQECEVETGDLLDGLGYAEFELPYLDKPLAPGVYRLQAEIPFAEQHPRVRESLEWVSDLYGSSYEPAETILENGERGWRMKEFNIFESDKRRRQRYNELLYEVGSVSDEGVLFAGRTRRSGQVTLSDSSVAGQERAPACVFWTTHETIMQQVHEAEEEITYLTQTLPRIDEDRERRERRVDQLKNSIWRAGGRLSQEERRGLHAAQKMRRIALKQIASFQDALRLKFWVIASGHLLYTGWHSINHPGYATWDAIKRQEFPPLGDAPSIDPRKWEERGHDWRRQPERLRDIAFEYLRLKEETDTWDPRRFTTRTEEIRFNARTWRTLRAEQLAVLQAGLDETLEGADFSGFAVQPLYNARNLVNECAAHVGELSFAWEHYIRTTLQDESSEGVVESWKDELIRSSSLYGSIDPADCTATPGEIYDRFLGARERLMEAVDLKEFRMRWFTAADRGERLPGVDE